MKDRDMTKRRAQISGDKLDWNEYKKERNQIRSDQKKGKREWAIEKINPSLKDSKLLWNTIKSITKEKNQQAIQKLRIGGKIVEGKREMATGLNNFFVEKIVKMVEQLPAPEEDLLIKLKSQSPIDIPKQELKEIRMIDLERLMKGVRRTTAAGVDAISGIILHDIFSMIKLPLLHMINLSQATGTYPRIFKLTKLIPLVKAGKDSVEASSYRPVANLSVLGKLIERAVMEQLDQHIEKNSLTNKDQHGGRPGHSTTTCLGEIVEDIREAQEAKLRVALVAIDLSAAFDTINHPIMIEKVRHLNVDSLTVKWLSSFLSDRNQLVEIEGVWSEPIKTGEQGVVQGGPSSGKLFNVYMDKLPMQVNNEKLATTPAESTAKQYVDDDTMIVRGKDINQLIANITSDYKNTRSFLINHRMVINDQKTQMMIINPRKDDIQTVDLNGNRITHQETIKILGMTLNQDLKWDSHLWKGSGHMARSIQVKSSLIKVIKPFIPEKMLFRVGQALINSTILYAAPIWGATTEENRNRVQAAQTRAARIATGEWNRKGKKSHRQQLLDRIGWLNVNQLIATSTLNLLKKSTHNETSFGLKKLFKITQTKANTRHKGLRINHHGHPNKANKSFATNSVIMFNELKPKLRNPQLTSKQFKMKLRMTNKETNRLTEH